ncbi:MAG: chemotaxis-specific protein-glutamate methyltransferase CheB [Pirellulales bacterium]|nr:chemotaxis-specific protein-glutamate methyltransferase CheB [Pirellulales bacterium]
MSTDKRAIRVLVVDDSAVIREMIRDFVGAADGMEVAGTARDGCEALEILKTQDVDVVTLDVQMPNMDGLAALDAMLAQRAVPVVMVSALTRLGCEITLEALDRGAIDYVAKPTSHAEVSETFGVELIRKIRTASGADVRRILRIRRDRKQRRAAARAKAAKHVSTDCPRPWVDKCVVVGISTGGPPALAALFQALRPPMPPIVVVQHMPARFTRPLAARLDAQSELFIREASEGDPLLPNHALIAPGGIHLHLVRHGDQVKVALRDGPPVSGHKPSVDVMMTCAAEVFPGRCLGVIMTGMGRDGVEGCRRIREVGGYVLGQDEPTSDVYGMNKVAFLQGHVDQQFALDEAATTLRRQIGRLWPVAASTAGV